MENQHHNSIHDSDVPTSADTVRAFANFLRVVQQRKSYVIWACVIAGAFGALYYFTEPPVYQAKASLLVSQSNSDVLRNPGAEQSTQTGFIPTYEHLFSKGKVLAGAIQRLKNQPPEMLVDLAPVPKNQWIEALRKRLSAKATRRTNIIELTYNSMNPKAAEAVVNAIVDSYTEFMNKHHKDASGDVATILDRELVEVAKKLEEKHSEYIKAQHDAGQYIGEGGNDTQHPVVERALRINEHLIEVQKRRVDLQASLVAIHNAVRDDGDLRHHLASFEPQVAKELISSVLGVSPQTSENLNTIERKLFEDRAKLETWSAHLAERHPIIIRLTREIGNAEEYLKNHQSSVQERMAKIDNTRLAPILISMVEQRISKTRAYENELDSEYKRAEAAAIQLNDSMANLQRVKGELNRLTGLHQTLMNRLNDIDLGKEGGMRVKVVTDPIASNDPVAPRLSLVVLFCLFSGLGTGIGTVYVMDLLDDRFRSPEEMSQQLNLPVLAMVRDLPLANETGVDAIHVHVAPETPESEAFRTLRTTLAFSGQDTERLAVTSTEPSDGKTTVLVNLAVSCAQAGRRTVLIDADLRKPGLSKIFGLRNLPGLSDALRARGDVAKESRMRVQATGIEDLDVLPAGPKSSDPAELLSHSRLAEIITWAATQYDQVLIDCPPTLAASDALIVGRLADGLLMVVQPEKNHRRQVVRAVSSIQNMNINVIGVVANRIGDDKIGYDAYGYGMEYRDESDGDDESDKHVIPFDQTRSSQSYPRRRAA